MDTNESVAFHTITVTVPTSLKETTPKTSAKTAPPAADQPIDRPRGCQMTKIKVF